MRIYQIRDIMKFPHHLQGITCPPKHVLRLIDEHFESESVDVSTVSSSAVKTVDVNHKGMVSTEEPKRVMQNNFSPTIIEDWHSDDESKVEISPVVEGRIVRIKRLLSAVEVIAVEVTTASED
nr:hypothetical protein [Tanacetum cinerariifolium]